MEKFPRLHSFADATTLLMIIAAIALASGFWHIAASRFGLLARLCRSYASSAPEAKKAVSPRSR